MIGDQFDIAATPAALAFMSKIATEMVHIFGIDRREAVGRINKFWSGRKEFLTDTQTSLLFRENPVFWAKTIYYRDDAYWWRGEEGLSPRDYP
jgi:hypothetical protein